MTLFYPFILDLIPYDFYVIYTLSITHMTNYIIKYKNKNIILITYI